MVGGVALILYHRLYGRKWFMAVYLFQGELLERFKEGQVVMEALVSNLERYFSFIFMSFKYGSSYEEN